MRILTKAPKELQNNSEGVIYTSAKGFYLVKPSTAKKDKDLVMELIFLEVDGKRTKISGIFKTQTKNTYLMSLKCEKFNSFYFVTFSNGGEIIYFRKRSLKVLETGKIYKFERKTQKINHPDFRKKKAPNRKNYGNKNYGNSRNNGNNGNNGNRRTDNRNTSRNSYSNKSSANYRRGYNNSSTNTFSNSSGSYNNSPNQAQ